MSEDAASHERIHCENHFFEVLGKLRAQHPDEAVFVGIALSNAADMLLIRPRPPLPIKKYGRSGKIWQYDFLPGYAFTYAAEDWPLPDGSVERHYFLLEFKTRSR